MRHFWVVVGAVAGNFILWLLITKLPAPDIVLFGLAIAIGCLMLYVIVRFGKEKRRSST
jgi:hypothetical protein